MLTLTLTLTPEDVKLPRRREDLAVVVTHSGYCGASPCQCGGCPPTTDAPPAEKPPSAEQWAKAEDHIYSHFSPDYLRRSGRPQEKIKEAFKADGWDVKADETGIWARRKPRRL